jgi:hypothetical protein
VRVIRLADVGHQAPRGEVALFFVQPLGRCWVVGEDEAGGDGDADGDDAFDDEEPSPSCDTHASVEVAEDAGGLLWSQYVAVTLKGLRRFTKRPPNIFANALPE